MSLATGTRMLSTALGPSFPGEEKEEKEEEEEEMKETASRRSATAAPSRSSSSLTGGWEVEAGRGESGGCRVQGGAGHRAGNGGSMHMMHVLDLRLSKPLLSTPLQPGRSAQHLLEYLRRAGLPGGLPCAG